MEKAKFPMPSMNITQGYNEGTHLGTYALDLAGEDAGIDWVLAPFTGKIVNIESASYGNWYWFESLDEVLCANGEVTKLTCMFGHDNEIRHNIGDIINQGEHLCLEGTSGQATGNHCHLEVGLGEYQGNWYQNEYGIYMLYNEVKPNEYLCLPDDYIVINDKGYNWIKESEVKDPIILQKLYLPATADTWRVYPLDKQPVVGNECGYLLPSKFEGLTYEIKSWSMPDVAIIDTRDFGRVQIYVAPETGAIIK